jgi:hypothetical protein
MRASGAVHERMEGFRSSSMFLLKEVDPGVRQRMIQMQRWRGSLAAIRLGRNSQNPAEILPSDLFTHNHYCNKSFQILGG